jgi:hypothetical protein
LSEASGRGGRKRGDAGQNVFTPADRLLETSAIRAVAQMGAYVPPPRNPSVGIGEDPGHRLALQAAAVIHLLEVAPGLVEGLAHDGATGVEGGPDLREVEPAQLAHHQHRPLALGQVREVLQQPLQLLAMLRSLGDTRPPVDEMAIQDLGRVPGSPEFDCLVVRDSVEPRP